MTIFNRVAPLLVLLCLAWLPQAAAAGEPVPASSSITTLETVPEVMAGSGIRTQVYLMDASNHFVDGDRTVYIWAERTTAPGIMSGALNGTSNGYVVRATAKDGILSRFDLSFARSGSYVLHASLEEPTQERLDKGLVQELRNTDTHRLTVLARTVPAHLEDTQRVDMWIGGTTMRVFEREVVLDMAPTIVNGRTYVPFRALAEAFGAEVQFDADRREVQTALDGRRLVMLPDVPYYYVNGVQDVSDAAPYIDAASGRTMVPVRVAAETLGFALTPVYDDAGHTVRVSFSK